MGEKREGDGDGDTRGKINRGDGDVHERDKTGGDRADRDAGDGKIEGRLHGTDGVKEDAHTYTEVARLNGGGLTERVETRCEQRGSLLREWRETLCPLEADHDQAGPVVLCEFEGTSEANGCTRSLGGMEAPGAREVTRFPSVSVPVCVVMRATPCVSGVVASVPECVLPSTPCRKGAPQAEGAACAPETARVCEARCMRETPRVSAPAGVSGVVCVSEARVSERPCVGRVTACVRSLCAREMSVAMREHAAASPGVRLNVRVMECSLGVVTRRCAWIAWRR